MAQSLWQDPPQAQGNFYNNVSKACVLFWQWLNGEYSPTISTGGQTIPENDEQILTYVAATNNIQNITYYKAGVQVAQQTFEYKNLGVADDDLIVRITLH